MALPISLIKSLFVQQPAPGTSKAIKVDEEMDFEDDEEAGDSPNHPSAMFLITR
jgi:hypothetical protein